MSSPARKHFQRMKAAKEAAASTPSRPHGESYDMFRASIIEDARRLHDIQSIERKIEAKRALLPAYDDYVDGVLSSGTGQQDDVLMTLMVWHLDAGNLERGLKIASYAIKFGLETPDRYQRGTAALVAEEVAEHALKSMDSGDFDAASLFEPVYETVLMTADMDMHDQIRSKLYKAYGYLLMELDEKSKALLALQRAVELNDRIGVKKDIAALEKALKNSGE